MYTIKQNLQFQIDSFLFQAEESQTVTTHYGAETDVRNGVVADHTAAIPFAFWRSLARLPFSTDDCLKISGGIVSKTTDELPKLSGNRQTVVEVSTCTAQLLLLNKKKNHKIYPTPHDHLVYLKRKYIQSNPSIC